MFIGWASRTYAVMAELVPAIYVVVPMRKRVDARVKPGHDDAEAWRLFDGHCHALTQQFKP
jgi:hypothetical protein